jgi:hypothetical protein
VDDDDAGEDRPRRWGCVIPVAVLGLVFSAAGASMLYDWWRAGATMSMYLFILCVFGGPGLLVFALKTYSDPDF